MTISFVPQTDKICADFEKRIQTLFTSSSAATGAPTRGHHNGHSPAPGSALAACAAAQAEAGSLVLAATGSTGGLHLGRAEEELLKQHLKRKHAASILSLKEEFMRKRKKGKLPTDATSALKTWWLANLVWPYPTVRCKQPSPASESPISSTVLRRARAAGQRQARARRRDEPQRHADQQLCARRDVGG